MDWGVAQRARRRHRRAPSGARRAAAVRPARSSRWSAARRLFAQEPIQSRVASAPSARFVVQDLRVYGGDRQRHAADDDRGRYAGLAIRWATARSWSPEDDDHRFLGRDHAALRARAIAQRRRRQTRAAGRHRSRHRVRASHGRDGAARSRIFRSRSALGRYAARSGRGYATLANQGIHIDPSPLRVVRDSLGSTCSTIAFRKQTEVVSAGTAYVMTTMLEERHPRRHRLSECRDRPSRRRQDRHDVRFSRRVVRRLHARSRDGRVARQRRLSRDERIVRRQHSRAHVGALHARRARERSQARILVSLDRSAQDRVLRRTEEI